MGLEYSALALVELSGQLTYLTDLDLVEHSLVRLFGNGIDDRVTDRSGGLAVRAQALLQATRRALGHSVRRDRADPAAGCNVYRRQLWASGCWHVRIKATA